MSRPRTVTAWALAGIAGAFLLFDAAIHVWRPDPVVDAFADIGVPDSLSLPLGVLELSLLALYFAPPTAFLGVTLWTGYLGGAILANLRAGMPFFTHVLFPAYVALLLWGSLWLRDGRVRALLPLRASAGRSA